MSASGYERKFWWPLIFVRFTPQSRHTEAQCPLLGLKRIIYSRVGGAETKMKRPVRLLGRAAPNPKLLSNPFGPPGNSELESKTSTGEPTNTLNSTMTLANKFRRHNPNSIHTPVEYGDARRVGRAHGEA